MTSGPLCLPMGSGRRAFRTCPGTGRRQRHSSATSPWSATLLYALFLVLLMVGCSSGHARLEASSDTIRAEDADVQTVAAPADSPDRADPAEATETPEHSPAATQPSESSLEAASDTEPPAVTEATLATEASPSDTQADDTQELAAQASPDPAAEQQQAVEASPQEEVWEEDGVREQFGEGYTKVVFADILSKDGYKYSLLQDPPRLVVDIKQPTREVWFNRLPLKGGAFERIRVGRHPDKIRFVLDLREEGRPEPLVEAEGENLVVLAGAIPQRADLPDAIGGPETGPASDAQIAEPASVEAASALEDADLPPAPMGGPEVPVQVAKADWKPIRVTGIDFRQTGSASDVLISTDGKAAYDVQEKDDAIVVVLPGAKIPEHLQRPLDTEAFPSAILAIKPQQVGSGPTGKVMFTIRLREKRPYNVLQDDKGIRVSVLLPEKPPEIPLLPPPALPKAEGLAKAEAQPPAEPAAAKAEEKPAAEAQGKEKAPPQAVPPPSPKSAAVKIPWHRQFVAKNYRGQKISLDFKDADIQNVLRLIAEVSNKNIVISEAVKGKVTVRLLNVPWDMALDVILKTYALEKEELGPNIIRVAPYSQLKKEREEARKADEALERVETLQTKILPVNYAKADDLSSLLAKLKSKRPDATILVDSRTNAIIIRDLPGNIKEMIDLVRELDTQTPQVLIEAKIVELDVDFEREIGIQWGTMYQAGPATGNPTGLNFPHTASIGGAVDNITGEAVPGIANPVVNLPAAVDSSGGGALGFSLASITNSFQLDAQLSAMEKRNHARVLSSPRVATLSNQEAKINQGQEVPYQTTSDEGTKTEFKEAVLALSVTPQITFDGSIIMNIVVTNDTPIRDPTVGFIIGKKEANTTVLVRDGETAVIGGIYTNNQAESLGGVPYLMDLPVAGYLFKKKGTTSKRTELVIFITPRIIPTRTVQVDEWTEANKKGSEHPSPPETGKQ